jgi:hypothetical protein
MTFDLHRILESKRTLRRKLARRPVAEKLAMLDALRHRACTIRQAATRKPAPASPCIGGSPVSESNTCTP